MLTAFSELLVLLSDDHTLSAYELHSSGVVQVLVSCLNVRYRVNISVRGGGGGGVKLKMG